MEYRRLGRTDRDVSIMGIGGGYVMLRDLQAGTELYQRAYELGVNYFDGRYGATSSMQRPVIAQDREHFIIATKTVASDPEQVLRRIDEDLNELGTDYLDIFYLRAYNQEMIDRAFSPGGAVEALLEARGQRKIRALGLAGHSDLRALAAGVETGLIDVVEFPLNVVRREAIDVLIPACREHDAGMVIMKPMNVGLAPAEVCLTWLVNQPIHVMAAGVSTIEQLEFDVSVLDRARISLSPAEAEEAERWRLILDRATCRICDQRCQPLCKPRLRIDWLLYHNVLQNELRRLGVEGFIDYPFSPWVKKIAEQRFQETLDELRRCTRCGKCESVCPYHLPIIGMFDRMREEQESLLAALQRSDWAATYLDARSPIPG